ncbi:MAG: Vi polysaccharide biosynthesis UDP-N-acetylglucosamine C-6 dehydrogenase TviB, partial [Wenzhouxiangella sp.]
MPPLQQTLTDTEIAIIGLGYVGLPLALAFGRIRPTLGFDIDTRRVEELQRGIDSTRECSQDDLAAATRLTITAVEAELQRAR